MQSSLRTGRGGLRSPRCTWGRNLDAAAAAAEAAATTRRSRRRQEVATPRGIGTSRRRRPRGGRAWPCSRGWLAIRNFLSGGSTSRRTRTCDLFEPTMGLRRAISTTFSLLVTTTRTQESVSRRRDEIWFWPRDLVQNLRRNRPLGRAAAAPRHWPTFISALHPACPLCRRPDRGHNTCAEPTIGRRRKGLGTAQRLPSDMRPSSENLKGIPRVYHGPGGQSQS